MEDIIGTSADLVTKSIEEKNDKKIMLEELGKLNKREKEIMTLRYGLSGKEEKTQKEVAEIMGISQSYISRIEKKVIKRLQNVIKV